MEVIGHNHIATYIDTFVKEKVKPVINQVIAFGYLKQALPFVAGETSKIKNIVFFLSF